MLRKTLLTLSLLSSLGAYAQDQKAYDDWIQKANTYYDAKEYRKSGEAFSKAFEALDWKGRPDDKYNAACSWAMAGVPDSAFFMLTRIATKSNYTNLNHLLADTDLEGLHKDKRWDEVIMGNKPVAVLCDNDYWKYEIVMKDHVATLRRKLK